MRKVLVLRVEYDDVSVAFHGDGDGEFSIVDELQSTLDYEGIDADVQAVHSFDLTPGRIDRVLEGDSGDAEAALLVDIRDRLIDLFGLEEEEDEE